jgi:hypothetical protein
MGLPMAVRACGAPYCPVEASAPDPLCRALGAEPSVPDIFAGIADSVQSAGVPRLKPRLLGLENPHELAGSAAPEMP